MATTPGQPGALSEEQRALVEAKRQRALELRRQRALVPTASANAPAHPPSGALAAPPCAGVPPAGAARPPTAPPCAEPQRPGGAPAGAAGRAAAPAPPAAPPHAVHLPPPIALGAVPGGAPRARVPHAAPPPSCAARAPSAASARAHAAHAAPRGAACAQQPAERTRPPAPEPEYVRGLNGAQRSAVLAPADSSLAVLAGAGSGKTAVMTRRVQHLLACGVPPAGVLAITFTRAAADEMRARLARACPHALVAASGGARGARGRGRGGRDGGGRGRQPRADGVRVSTFHSLCLWLCARYAKHLPDAPCGADGTVTLVASSAQRKAVRAALRARAERRADDGEARGEGGGAGGGAAAGTKAERKRELRRVLSALCRARALGVHSSDPAAPALRASDDASLRRLGFPELSAKLVGGYEEELRRAGALDFCDLVRVASAVLRAAHAAKARAAEGGGAGCAAAAAEAAAAAAGAAGAAEGGGAGCTAAAAEAAAAAAGSAGAAAGAAGAAAATAAPDGAAARAPRRLATRASASERALAALPLPTHVLVDEVQDCSGPQLGLLRLLAPPPHGRLTAVGDDDQSIYSFQGAEGGAAFFGSLMREYAPRARCVALNVNYRCAPRVVAAANALIARNGAEHRAPKPVAVSAAAAAAAGAGGAAHVPAGARVRVVRCRNGAVEAVHVARLLARARAEIAISWGQMAVLSRTARAGAAVHAALRAARVPCAAPPTNLFSLRPTRQLRALLRLAAAALPAERRAAPPAAPAPAPAAQVAAAAARALAADAPPRARADGAARPPADGDVVTVVRAMQPPPPAAAAEHAGARPRGAAPARTAADAVRAHAKQWRVPCWAALAELADAAEATGAARARGGGGGGARRKRAREGAAPPPAESAAPAAADVRAAAPGAAAAAAAAADERAAADGGAAAAGGGAAAAAAERAAAARAAVRALTPPHASALARALSAVETVRARAHTLQLHGLLTRAAGMLGAPGRFHSRPGGGADGGADGGGAQHLEAAAGRGGGAARRERAPGALLGGARPGAPGAQPSLGPGAAAAVARAASAAARAAASQGGGGAAGGGSAGLLGGLGDDGDDRSLLQRLCAHAEAWAHTWAAGADGAAPDGGIGGGGGDGSGGGGVGGSGGISGGGGGDRADFMARLRAYLAHTEREEAEGELERRAHAADAVALETIHGSKGLEWRLVVVVRANEGELPLLGPGGAADAVATPAAAERAAAALREERRLAYVACTRARELLVLTHVERDDGAGAPMRRSRFVDEIVADAPGAVEVAEGVDEVTLPGDDALFARACAAPPPPPPG